MLSIFFTFVSSELGLVIIAGDGGLVEGRRGVRRRLVVFLGDLGEFKRSRLSEVKDS